MEASINDPISKRYFDEISQILSNNHVEFVKQPDCEKSESHQLLEEWSDHFNVKDINTNRQDFLSVIISCIK